MSQAFVKEGDQSDDLPERPLGERPNYVTPEGLAALRRARDELSARRAELSKVRTREDPQLKLVERDLRYFEARVDSAILVDRSKDKPEDVRFGAEVELDGDGGRRRYRIVGEDEADPACGRLSWSSPLALALMGAKPGDRVRWAGPEGEASAAVVCLRYP